MKAILTIFFSLILIPNMLGCGCIGEGKISKKIYKKYDLIISGKVIIVETGQFNQLFTIEIENKYKIKDNTDLIKISTTISSCELTVKVGEKWLIYAHKTENGYSTGICSRSKILDNESDYFNKTELKSDLRFLKKKLKK